MFNIDIMTWPTFGGAVRIIIKDPKVIEKILTHLDTEAAENQTAQLPPCRAPPQARRFG